MGGAATVAVSDRIRRADWAEARPHLSRALGYVDVADAVAAEVAAGAAEVWRIDHDNGRASYMVTRVEGSEVVIVAYEGERCRPVMRALVEHLRARGFASLRFHTTMPWLIELFRDYEPEPLEYVVRVYLDGRAKQKLYN